MSYPADVDTYAPPGARDVLAFRDFWRKVRVSHPAEFPPDPGWIALSLLVPLEDGGLFSRAELDRFTENPVRSYIVDRWRNLSKSDLDLSRLAVATALTGSYAFWHDRPEVGVLFYTERDKFINIVVKLVPLLAEASQPAKVSTYAPALNLTKLLGEAKKAPWISTTPQQDMKLLIVGGILGGGAIAATLTAWIVNRKSEPRKDPKDSEP